MKNIRRYFLRKYCRSEIEKIIDETMSRIRGVAPAVEQIIVFGSALTNFFDDESDLDLVLIFATPAETRLGERALYRVAHTFNREIDFLCIEKDAFQQKAALGGVYWLAANEGMQVFPRAL